MKKALVVLVLLACVSALGFSQTVFTVRNTAGWIEAVGNIRSGGNSKAYTITVTGTVSVPAAPSEENTFGTVTGLTVTIEGSGTLSLSNNGSLLRIGNNQTVVAKDLTLKGRDNNNASVVEIAKGGTFRMEGKATVTGNKTSSYGGGVDNNGTFTMNGGTISGNESFNSTWSGGGVYNEGTFTMQSGMISGNTASTSNYHYSAGGVLSVSGTFIMSGGAISGNTSTKYKFGGGGVCVRSTFTMSGGTISDNKSESGAGVGVYKTFTMTGGTISGNIASDNGGGVFVSSQDGYDAVEGTFTMSGGTISGNKSSFGGGGVCVDKEGTFIMQDNASVLGNTAIVGGGVYLTYKGGTFNLIGGTISGNKSNEFGGGVFVFRGTMTMQGGTISGNTAAFYGGGVYVGFYREESYRYYGTFTKTGGTIYGDDADQKLKNTVISKMGHAIYEAKNEGWRNSTAGPTMNPNSYGFWLNDGDVFTFPSDFEGIWKRSNFNNWLRIIGTVMKSSSSDYYWVLQKISGNAYTLKRADAANTMTLTIKLERGTLVISGDSGSGENNWNGTWWDMIND